MADNSRRVAENGRIIFVFSFLILLTYLALFFLRSLDDNRLTSWQLAFERTGILKFFFMGSASLISAYILSRLSLLERHPLLCIFSASYAAAALFWREPEVIVDASRYFTQAKHLEIYGAGYFIREWGRDIAAWTDMPLVPFFYGMIFKFFGESRIYIQAFTSLLFSMTAVLTFLTGKTLWDEAAGFSAGWFLLGIPYLFTQVPIMLVDVPAMFFLTLAVFTFIKVLDRGGVWIIFSSVSIFFAFFSKYSTWPMLSVLIVIFLAYMLRKPDSELRPNYTYRGAMVALISTVLIGIVFWYKLDFFLEQIKFLFSYQKPGLKTWGESLISTFFFQINPLITFSALYSVYYAVKKKDLKYAIIGWMLFLTALFQINRIRYIIIVFPMLSLMASYGIMGIKSRRNVRFITLAAVSFSIIIAAFVYLPFVRNVSVLNLKDAGEFLNSTKKSNVRVLSVAPENPVLNPAVSVPLFDVYAKKKICFDYEKVPYRDPDEIKTSPLRFTWEYKNPAYYLCDEPMDKNILAVVVIRGEAGIRLPEEIQKKVAGFQNIKDFDVPDDIYVYQTILSVYY